MKNSFLNTPPSIPASVVASLHSFTHTLLHLKHSRFTPHEEEAICRGLAAFLHRTMVMQADVGSSFTSAFQHGRGPVAVRARPRVKETNPNPGQGKKKTFCLGFTVAVIFVFLLRISTLPFPPFFQTIFFLCCLGRDSSRNRHDVNRSAQLVLQTHTHKHTHTHTRIRV